MTYFLSSLSAAKHETASALEELRKMSQSEIVRMSREEVATARNHIEELRSALEHIDHAIDQYDAIAEEIKVE